MDSNTPLGSDGQVAYRVESAFEKLGIGRTTGYAEIASGRLRSFRVGKRRLVPASALTEYIADRMAEEQANTAPPHSAA